MAGFPTICSSQAQSNVRVIDNQTVWIDSPTGLGNYSIVQLTNYGMVGTTAAAGNAVHMRNPPTVDINYSGGFNIFSGQIFWWRCHRGRCAGRQRRRYAAYSVG